MSSGRVRLELGEIALLTLEGGPRPPLLDRAALSELDAAVSTALADDGVRALLLTGPEGAAFCGGGDLRELRDMEPSEAAERSREGQRVLERIASSPVPTLAALSGDAVGAGLELALACHLRSAARHVGMSLPEVRLGLVPGHGGTQRLPRLVGRSRALALMLTGRAVGAEEALELGLVDAVFDGQDLISGSRRLLEGAARGARSAVRLLLEAVREGEELPLADGLRLEASLFGLAFAEPSAREGMLAFLEKREPRFGDA